MHLYWTGRPAQFLRTEVDPLENGKFYRVPAFVVLGVLVISLAWFEGCGGLLGSGSGGNSTLTGTLVDSKTNRPVPGALVVLEQADATGATDRIVLSTVSAADGTFGFKPSPSGTYDVVADATVTPTAGSSVTYAATVTYGIPATASLGQIPLVSVSGSSTSTGGPVTLTNQISSSRTAGSPDPVDVTLSALQSVSPAVGLITQITIPVFAGSTPTITTSGSISSCPNGTDCATYSLLVPAGDFSFGNFSSSGTRYSLATQQSQVSYAVEGKAFVVNAPLSETCTPPAISSTILITNGTPGLANPDIAFTGCQ